MQAAIEAVPDQVADEARGRVPIDPKRARPETVYKHSSSATIRADLRNRRLAARRRSGGSGWGSRTSHS
jgi:hypothetical protein